MIPIKGIYQDNNKAEQPQGFAFSVRNGVVYNGVYQNEEGHVEHSDIFNSRGLTPIGILKVNNGQKVIFSIRTDGLDEIGILDKDGSYEVRLIFDLGFNIDYPIDAEAQYNYKNDLVVAFTDGLNTPKIINLDDIVQPFTLTSIEMFPSFLEPNLDAEIVEGGGTVPTGAYQFYIRYKDFDGTITAASHLTNPVFITNSNINGTFDGFTGAPANTPSNKSIRVIVNNVDTNYKQIIIGVVSKIDGVVTPYQLTEVNITGSTFSYIYTGGEEKTDVTLGEILQQGIYYNTIKHLTQVNGALYGASVTEEAPLNLQQYANQFRFKWVATLKDTLELDESYKVHEQNYEQRPFCHGEVYAFYVRWKLIKGGWTEGFHIPGRAVQPITLGGISGSENSLNSLFLFGSIDNLYLGEDVNIDTESKYFQTRDTTRNIQSYTADGFIGDFGFWENENEVYPSTDDFAPLNGSEDLRGKKVRHFKFPSQAKMAGLYSSKAGYGTYLRDILGFRIEAVPTLPAELANKVQGFQIYYAERSNANISIVGDDIVLYGANYVVSSQPTDTRIWTTGGNHAFRRPDDITITPNKRKLRFHGFDLLKDKSSTLPTYMESYLTLVVNNDDQTRTENHYIGNYQNYNDGSTFEWSYGYHFLNNSKSADVTTRQVPLDFQVRRLSNVQYVPSNVIASNNYNRDAEEFLSADLLGPDNIGINISYYYYRDNNDANYFQFHETNACTLKVYRKDMYVTYHQQRLVSTGKYFSSNPVGQIVYGGDVFLGNYSFITYSNLLYPVETGTSNGQRWRFKFLRNHIIESRANASLRHEDTGDAHSKFYPKEPIQGNNTWFLPFRDDAYNMIAYNNDYTSINNILSYSIRNPDARDFVEEDLYKIIRSQIPNREEPNPSWRVWKANDYYIIPRNRGIITNIQGIGSNLFINTETSLFITIGSERLATNATQVDVGVGDIFERPPKELIVDDTGFAGCQHKYSCYLTPVGYLFIDADKKQVYISNGETVDSLNIGLNNFLWDNLAANGDNPFKGLGYTVAWDEKYKRILIGKQGEGAFTLSYMPSLKSWTSFHDYIPNYLYNDRDEMFGIYNNKIYKFNQGRYGYYFDNINPAPFYIVGVINDGNTQGSHIEKQLGNINWRTDVLVGNVIDRDKTFNQLLVWNNYQSTGNRGLSEFNPSIRLTDNFGSANVRRAKDLWNYNQLRDWVEDNSIPFIDGVDSIESNINSTKSFELRRRLISTFFMYKLLFSNEKINNLHPRIQVLDIDYKLKIVRR